MVETFNLATNMGVILVRSLVIVKKEDIKHAQNTTAPVSP
jgi:hypothetical protein